MTTKKPDNTVSVREASEKTGLSRAIVSRLCQRGIIGKRIDFPEFSQHCYRISPDDLATLADRKKDWQKKLSKKA